MNATEIICLLGYGSSTETAERLKESKNESPHLYDANQLIASLHSDPSRGGIGTSEDGTYWVEVNHSKQTNIMSAKISDTEFEVKHVALTSSGSVKKVSGDDINVMIMAILLLRYRENLGWENSIPPSFGESLSLSDWTHQIKEVLNDLPNPHITGVRKNYINTFEFSVTPIIGDFTELPKEVVSSSISSKSEVCSGSQLNGLLTMGRELTKAEKILVPVLDDTYIPSQYEYDIALDVHKSKTIRNFMLAGPAGTGKTETAKAVAATLGLPYVTFICETGTDSTKLFCNFIPNTEELSNPEESLLKRLGYDSYDDLVSDAEMDPEYLLTKLTGVCEFDDTSPEKCLATFKEKVAEEEGKKMSLYKYVESPIVTAFRHGYVLEIQEPTTIKDPAVLTEMNDVMTKKGSLRIPFTGEIVERHPHTTVIYTTNMGYIGCRPLNQSVIDRVDVCHWIESIDNNTLIQRISKQSGLTDLTVLQKMIQVYDFVREKLEENDDQQGVAGPRSLIAWASKYQINKDLFSSCIATLISKASMDREIRLELTDGIRAIL